MTWSDLSAARSVPSEHALTPELDVKAEPYVRILVIDMTAIGNGTATGEIKANIFRGWPDDRFMQLHASASGSLSLFNPSSRDLSAHDLEQLPEAIAAFAPELILYRPVPDDPVLHRAAMRTIAAFPRVPLAVWVMDDWPARLAVDAPERFAAFDRDWRWLLNRASLHLSIGEAMSAVFRERYGYEFIPFANGIDPGDWPAARTSPSRPFVIRYAGALAADMTADSILRVAQAVEELASEGRDIRLEIHTKPLWKNAQATRYASLSHTRFSTQPLSAEEYKAWLCGGDAVVIGYNFDPASLRYIGLSMANKMPECLATGLPVVAHGPSEAATIAYLKERDCALMVEAPDQGAVVTALRCLMQDSELYARLAAKGRAVALASHNIVDLRARFAAALRNAATTARSHQEGNISTISFGRDAKITVDETAVVAHLLADRRGADKIMLDIGAHFGTSAKFFDALGWTVHCFEPDPSNRAKLVAKFGTSKNVTIDPRAVSDKPASGVPFYKSNESTGISGLHAFRDTHLEGGRVDVTTIEEIVRTRHIGHVDFLKIDVEGFDFSVLKGVPWDRLMPDVVECEFEDYKTKPLGHTYADVANYLRDKGYVCYLSEWHPIIRYGASHDWRRLVPCPGPDLPSEAWGNILAFKKDPGYTKVAAAFEAVIRKTKPGFTLRLGPPPATIHTNDASPGTGKVDMAGRHDVNFAGHHAGKSSSVGQLEKARSLPSAMETTPFHSRVALWASARNPVVYRFGQFVMWCLRTAQRQKRAVAALALGLSGLVIGAIFAPGMWSAFFWIMLAGLGGLALLVAVLGFAGHLVKLSQDELRVEQNRALRTLTSEVGKLSAAQKVLLSELASLRKERSDEAEKLSVAHKALVSEVAGLRKEASDKLNEFIVTAGKQMSPSVGSLNIARFQSFSRTLKDADIATLINDWAKPLGLELSKSRLGYIAHRACMLERQMKGRFATAIETLVLRCLVASSLKREEVSILEIGTLFGIAAAAVYETVANEVEHVHLTVIDPLDGYYAAGNRDILTGAQISEQTLRQNWSLAPIPEKNFTIIKDVSESPQALEAARRRQYDVLIIDGDHSYEGVKRDFEMYVELVRPGGYILFDDYDVPDWPDIKRYVDSELAKVPFLYHLGSAFRTSVYQMKFSPRTRSSGGSDAAKV